jgi:hypothetical protein
MLQKNFVLYKYAIAWITYLGGCTSLTISDWVAVKSIYDRYWTAHKIQFMTDLYQESDWKE